MLEKNSAYKKHIWIAKRVEYLCLKRIAHDYTLRSTDITGKEKPGKIFAIMKHTINRDFSPAPLLSFTKRTL